MPDEQDRDVLYRIGVEAHPATKSVLEQLIQKSDAAQATMVDTAKAVADATIKSIRRISDARREAEAELRQQTTLVAAPTTAEAKQRAAVVAGVSQTATAAQQAAAARQGPEPKSPRPPYREPDLRSPTPAPEPHQATPTQRGVIDFGPEAQSAKSAADAHGLLSRSRVDSTESARGAVEASGKVSDALKKEAAAAKAASKARSQPSTPEPTGTSGTSAEKAVESHRDAEQQKTASTRKGAKDRTAAEEAAAQQDDVIQKKRVDFAKRAEANRLKVIKTAHDNQARMALEQAQRNQALKEEIGKKVAKFREQEAKKAARQHELDQMRAEQANLQAQSQYETAQARFKGLTEQVKGYKAQTIEAFSSGAESLMRMTRGVVAMGLASEENTEKMLRGLVKMQAVFDLGVGAVNMFARAGRAFDSLGKLMEAKRAVSAASAQAAAAASKLEAVALTEEAAAANSAAGAHANLNAQRGGGGLANAAGKIPFAGRKFAGMRMGGSPVALAGAGLAAAGGVAAAGYSINQLMGPERGTGEGSIASMEVEKFFAPLEKSTRWLGTRFQETGESLSGIGPAMRFFDQAGAQQESTVKILRRLNDSYDLHNRLVGQAITETRADLQFQAKEKAAQKLTGLNYQSRQSRQQMDSLVGGGTPQSARQNAIDNFRFQQAELAKQSNRLNSMKAETPEDVREYERRKPQIVEAQNNARQEMIRLGQERIRIEQQIGSEAKQRAQETTKALQDHLRLTKDRIKSEQERYLTDKERFGNLDPKEQKKLIALKGKADEAGWRALTPEQNIRRSQLHDQMRTTGALSAREGAELERIEQQRQRGAAKALTKEEQRLLARAGTGDTQAIARYGALDRASAAGYDQAFGRTSGIQRNIALQRGIQEKLEVKLTDQRKFEVKLEADTNNMVTQIANQVRPLMERHERNLREGVRTELTAALQEITSRDDASFHAHKTTAG